MINALEVGGEAVQDVVEAEGEAAVRAVLGDPGGGHLVVALVHDDVDDRLGAGDADEVRS